mmetsp:Transcript_15405/g.23489  ORF Transcript_15405/g.23489 Transcript_15405/m.23489 type:complete len:346 (+) Transcript_15405:98-1135(+)
MKVTLWGREVDLDFTEEDLPTEQERNDMDKQTPGVQHGWFKSRNGKALHYRFFLPDGPVKAVVVWQHGISAHSGISYTLKDGRKINMALLWQGMKKAGIAVYAIDMLGHGFSEGLRFYVPDYTLNRDDLDAFGRFVATSKHPNKKLFLAAESYGGTVALHVAHAWQKASNQLGFDFGGVMLNSPAIIGDLPPYPVVFFLRYGLAPFFPTWTPFFMPNPIPADRVWRDPEARALHTQSRVVDTGLTGAGAALRLGTGVQLLVALETVRTDVIPNLSVPFLIQHGSMDLGVPISGMEYLLEHAKTANADRVSKRWEGSFHDLFGEPAPVAEEVVDLMVEFVNARLKE